VSVVVEHDHFGELYCPSCETMFSEGRLCPNDGTRLVKLSLAQDPIIGRELDGRFTVLEKLGEGGMGAVYRAHQHSVDREVAIKVVHINLISNPETIKRFLREAKLTSKLNHPNAVGVLDFGQTEDGVFYLVMELVPGRPLDEILKEETSLSPSRVVRIGMQVCDALETAHDLQIVHRDLKPANIMLVESRRDFVKVLDFGLAKTLEIKDATREETLLGTPAFLPPERAAGGAGDARSDLYSLGCVLYLLATGSLPFQADSPKELVAAHASQRPPSLPGVPSAIAKVIQKLLAKQPIDRYQSAAETRDALEEAALRDNISAYQSSPNIEQARQARLASETHDGAIRSRRGLAIGVGIAALAILVFAIVWSGGSSESSPDKTQPAIAPTDKAEPPKPSPPDPAPAAETDTDPDPDPDDDATAKTDSPPPTDSAPPTSGRPNRKRPGRPARPASGKSNTGKPKLPF